MRAICNERVVFLTLIAHHCWLNFRLIKKNVFIQFRVIIQFYNNTPR